jgi:hypothetical protein
LVLMAGAAVAALSDALAGDCLLVQPAPATSSVAANTANPFIHLLIIGSPL